MGDARTAHDQQADHQQGHPPRAVVVVELPIGEDVADPSQPARLAQKPLEEHETAVRCESFVREGDREGGLDGCPNRALTLSH